MQDWQCIRAGEEIPFNEYGLGCSGLPPQIQGVPELMHS
jgi:hypothetical protein